MDYMNLFYHLCDMNGVEIKSHIEDGTLNSWLHSWKNEIVKMFVKANDNNRPRPCMVYSPEETVGIFRGFCDDNTKCVVELPNGEMHKVFVYHVQFTDIE